MKIGMTICTRWLQGLCESAPIDTVMNTGNLEQIYLFKGRVLLNTVPLVKLMVLYLLYTDTKDLECCDNAASKTPTWPRDSGTDISRHNIIITERYLSIRSKKKTNRGPDIQLSHTIDISGAFWYHSWSDSFRKFYAWLKCIMRAREVYSFFSSSSSSCVFSVVSGGTFSLMLFSLDLSLSLSDSAAANASRASRSSSSS